MSKSKQVRVDAAPYVDHDDCVGAAADAYAEANGLQGCDLDPKWADSQREEIVLTVPARTASITIVGNFRDEETMEWAGDGTVDLETDTIECAADISHAAYSAMEAKIAAGEMTGEVEDDGVTYRYTVDA